MGMRACGMGMRACGMGMRACFIKKRACGMGIRACGMGMRACGKHPVTTNAGTVFNSGPFFCFSCPHAARSSHVDLNGI